MGALDLIVRQGKALYVGISNYPAELAKEAIEILNQLGTPCLIHQPRYSMLVRDPEDELLDVLEDEGVGSIAYSPLAGGILTDRYLNGIPADSRAASNPSLPPERLTSAVLARVKKLNELALQRGQKLSQMSLAWVLRHDRLTSVLIGASRVSQIDDALGMMANREFTPEELKTIELILEDAI